MHKIDTYIGGGTSSLDADTVAWLAQLTTSFGTNPSAGFITALDTLIRGLKADGNWNPLDRFWIFAQEVQDYARVSIKNPSSTQITEVNTPTFTVNQGYTGNGINRYLNTNFNYLTDSVNTLRNSITHGIYVTTNIAESKFDCGHSSLGKDIVISARHGDGKTYMSANSSTGGAANVAVANSLGLYMVERASSTGMTAYKNGSSIATLNNADNAFPNTVDVVFGYNSNPNNNTVTINALSSKRIAMRVIGSGAINAATFYSRFQTFATTIGFNV